ncbi:hypothetical protein [Marinomonas sp. 2405UD68-3]|uniref:hypothetical protein n=1 Tax=Marinomonas sp. 2405UD68-3 TaxID=3391835 RepID=UPI0039C9C1B1
MKNEQQGDSNDFNESMLERTRETQSDQIGSDFPLLSQVKTTRRVASIMIFICFLLSIATLISAVLIIKLAHPEVREVVSYINDEQRVISELSIKSVPSINSSDIFVTECLRKLHTYTSSGYARELTSAQYCMDPSTFNDVLIRWGEFVNKYFAERKIVGGFTVDSIDVRYVHDITSPSPYGSIGCSKTIMNRYAGSLNCRTFSFDVETTANNYATGKNSKESFTGYLNLIIGTRQNMPNGMYIQLIDSK